MAKLVTRRAQNQQQRIRFFDQLAEAYQDSHGNAERLLTYRLNIIKPLIGKQQGTLLEIGCGTGMHLFALAGQFDRLIGTDFSPTMIKAAEAIKLKHTHQEKICFAVDPAEKLSTVEDQSIDVLLCVGAFEHMPEKKVVLNQVYRVLKTDGLFICLTPNAQYCWYTTFSNWLKLDTRHLNSDRFISALDFTELAGLTRLSIQQTGFWRFIPKGDMPSWIYPLLSLLDSHGKHWLSYKLRGGMFIKLVKAAQQ